MDKRKAKREQRKAQERDSETRLQERVAEAIEGGSALSGLRRQFSESILKRAFCRFAVEKPALLDRAIGLPPGNGLILIDECADPALLPELHRKFGRAVPSSLLFGKSVKDDELFEKAAAYGITAIISCDSVSAGTRDLCGIARRAYDNYATQTPHIVIVPQRADDALNALRQNAPLIREVLNRKQGHILNLDPARKSAPSLA